MIGPGLHRQRPQGEWFVGGDLFVADLVDRQFEDRLGELGEHAVDADVFAGDQHGEPRLADGVQLVGLCLDRVELRVRDVVTGRLPGEFQLSAGANHLFEEDPVVACGPVGVDGVSFVPDLRVGGPAHLPGKSLGGRDGLPGLVERGSQRQRARLEFGERVAGLRRVERGVGNDLGEGRKEVGDCLGAGLGIGVGGEDGRRGLGSGEPGREFEPFGEFVAGPLRCLGGGEAVRGEAVRSRCGPRRF
jgi:hypothetical protein